MSIDSDYALRFEGSRQLYGRAQGLMPSGVNHDVRRIVPFPVYVERAAGCRKWDVDGNEIIDYALGHGALMFGHHQPDIGRAIQDQVSRCLHPSAPTPAEVRWAELVTAMVPGAQSVRFVLSGTEATMLAMRLARGYTGRDVIVKLEAHFHGWHDYAMLGYVPPYEVPASSGVPESISGSVRVAAQTDLRSVEDAISRGDVAAVILEPGGALGGQVPAGADLLRSLRQLTRHYDTLLIFDEVITGFRLAPGGAQEHFGVTADLATFAKAIAGGVPAGAVAGSAEVMSILTFRDDAAWNRHRRVRHLGTFSGFPVAAAAGVAALELLRDGTAQDQAAAAADRLRQGMNDVMRAAGIGGCAYGMRSVVRLIVGEDLPVGLEPAEFLELVSISRLGEGPRPPLASALHKAQLLEGIDLLGGSHGFTCTAHSAADVDQSVAGFERALARLLDDGFVTRNPAVAKAHGSHV